MVELLALIIVGGFLVVTWQRIEAARQQGFEQGYSQGYRDALKPGGNHERDAGATSSGERA